MGAAELSFPHYPQPAGAEVLRAQVRDFLDSTINHFSAMGLGRVAWADHCEVLAVATCDEDAYLCRLPCDLLQTNMLANVAGEPRATCQINSKIASDRVVSLPMNFGFDVVHRVGAASRAVQMTGALGRILEMTVQYARERRQFGKPLAAFQAIQQQLAVMATQCAAAEAAACLAIEALSNNVSESAIAVAKIRVGEAAGIVAAGAHQIHGAMGFSAEYALHRFTRRLWAWRDEFGNEAFWSQVLGRNFSGSRRLWQDVAAI